MILLWFGNFYKRLMEDPRMNVLFDTRNEEASVSAAVHGKRLALALLSRWTDNDDYYREVGQNLFLRLEDAHQRAKKCPMRSRKLRRGFTIAQRDSWLGHLWLAGEACNISIRDATVKHLSCMMDIYGPFEAMDGEEA